MAGLWQRLLETLGTSKKAKYRRTSVKRRALRMESLEQRQTMDATISGLVFNDTDASNAMNGAEVGIGGVTVQLLNDLGTVGVFDVADTVAATTTSSSAAPTLGQYSFNVTTAGNYLVRQTPFTGFAQRHAQRTRAVTITSGNLTTVSSIQTIDSFDLPTGTTQTVAPTVTGTPVTSQFSNALIMGGQRDISATRTSAAGSFDVNVSILASSNNILRIAGDAGTEGQVALIYDGTGAADVDPGINDGAFSPVVDITSNGTAQGIRLNIGRDANPGSTINLVLRSASGTSTLAAALAIPVFSSGAPVELLIPFSTLTGTATLTAIQSVEIDVVSGASADIDVDQLETYGQFISTINLANIPAMTIGSLVFLDRNNDGLFAGADTGIGGVDLNLFNDLGVIGTFEPGTDTAVTIGTASTTSATSGTVGSYSFTGLLPGNYFVVIPASEFGAGQTLVNHISSPNTTTNDTNNQDHGNAFVAGVGVTAAVVLAAGAEPINDGDTDANTNLAIDFGFVTSVLQLTKTDTPDPVSIGSLLTYTLTATNTGPSNSTNTIITDTLPTGLTFSSGTFSVNGGAAQNATNTSGTITTAPFTLTSGQATIMTIIATVGAGFVTGTTNTGSVDSDEALPATANASTAVTPNIDLGITKTIVGGATTVGVGGTLTYRLTLVNNSTTTTVTAIRVTDDLPTGFTPGTLPTGSGFTLVAGTAPADLVWTVNSLAPSATTTVDIPVTVGTSVTPATGIRNTSTIDVAALVGFNDTVSTNNTSFIDVTVEPRFDLLLTKDDGITTAATGALITYTLSVNNSGPSAATNVAVSDTLPAQLTFVSATSGGNSFGTLTGQVLNGTLASVASGATTTISIVARVNANATGANFTNNATITPATPSQETGTRLNTASDTDTLTRTVTLNVDKVDSADPIVAGGTNFTYTITAFNSGTADAPNVLFSDPLPTGITFVGGTFAINETVPRTGTVTFNSTTNRLEANLGTLLAGGSAAVNRALITLNVQAAATAAAGTVTNTATLTSPDNTTGVTDSENTTINRTFDVTVTKTDNDGGNAVASGSTLIYTIIVSNTGVSAASSVGVSDPLPSNVTFVSATSSIGANVFTNSNGTVSGTIPSLVQGTPVTITVTTTVNNNTPDATVINNTTNVTATGESNTGNNSATTSSTVANLANLRGFVYVDSTRNSVRDTGEAGISGVVVTASATINGSAVSRTATSDANGEYVFTGLTPGVYTVVQSQPAGFTSAATNPGTVNGTVRGTAATDQIQTITLNGGDNSIANNFGETRVFSKRRFLASSSS